MLELAEHILDIAENSIRAGAGTVEIVINEDSAKDLLTIEINDNGSGMTKEEIKKVEDPFYTTKTVRRVGLGIPLLADAAKMARSTPGVRDVRVYTRAESEALLAPWLGEGLDLSELPTPRMIVVTLDADKRPNLAELKDELAAKTPAATLDDHRLWLERLGAMASTVVAIAALIFVLIVAVMAVAVASATRAAVATNREIVEVLHLVGASDDFIAREFERRFLALGLRGALIGGGAAAAFFALAGFVARRVDTTPGGEQIEAMFGSVSLGLSGYGVILILSAVVALLTGRMSRMIVMHRLRELN